LIEEEKQCLAKGSPSIPTKLAKIRPRELYKRRWASQNQRWIPTFSYQTAAERSTATNQRTDTICIAAFDVSHGCLSAQEHTGKAKLTGRPYFAAQSDCPACFGSYMRCNNARTCVGGERLNLLTSAASVPP